MINNLIKIVLNICGGILILSDEEGKYKKQFKSTVLDSFDFQNQHLFLLRRQQFCKLVFSLPEVISSVNSICFPLN